MRYAFCLTSGSGKTYLTLKYDNIYDIDAGMWFKGIQYADIYKQFKGEELIQAKVKWLEDFLFAKYPWGEPDLILLVHEPREARLLNADIVGQFKVPKENLLNVIEERLTDPEQKNPRQWMVDTMMYGWEDCKEEHGWEILSHGEIEKEVAWLHQRLNIS